jgi:hypothetical protein
MASWYEPSAVSGWRKRRPLEEAASPACAASSSGPRPECGPGDPSTAVEGRPRATLDVRLTAPPPSGVLAPPVALTSNWR